jgi:LmbE family N-acetylglucosaminyl deacetylase
MHKWSYVNHWNQGSAVPCDRNTAVREAMKTLREQIADGVACWCRNIPKGHPDHKEVSELSDLVTDILAEIERGPIGVLLRELGGVEMMPRMGGGDQAIQTLENVERAIEELGIK